MTAEDDKSARGLEPGSRGTDPDTKQIATKIGDGRKPGVDQVRSASAKAKGEKAKRTFHAPLADRRRLSRGELLLILGGEADRRFSRLTEYLRMNDQIRAEGRQLAAIKKEQRTPEQQKRLNELYAQVYGRENARYAWERVINEIHYILDEPARKELERLRAKMNDLIEDIVSGAMGMIPGTKNPVYGFLLGFAGNIIEKEVAQQLTDYLMPMPRSSPRALTP